MTISIPEFWQLVIDSQLLPPAECQRLGEQFGQVKGAAVQGNARTLAEWLIAQNVISRYQSTILLGGRAGPFVYGEYKIYDRVEGGPLAGQFKAVHAITGHPVVLKFFAGETVGDPQRWAATAERATRHAAIDHPHWWRSFELVDLEQFKFLSVADVKGQSATERLATGHRIPYSEACKLAYQAALALSRVHEAGFIHGDVRPDNLLIDGPGRAVLWCDPATTLSGIAPDSADELTYRRADYAAPELAHPGKSPDAQSDVYALGCTLYQMLSGEAPFAGGDVRQKMQRHAAEAIQPLSPLGVPEPLEKVVAYMMAKNAAVRYQQASQAAEQLGQFLDSAARHPQVVPVPSTLAALRQHLLQKPQPTPVRPAPVGTTSSSGAAQPIGPGAAAAAAGAGVPAATGGAPLAMTATAQRPSAPLATPHTSAALRGVAVGTVAGAGLAGSALGGPTSGPASSTQSPITTSSASERFKKKQPLTKNKPLLILLGCGAAFLLTLGVLAASGLFNGDEKPSQVAQNDSDPKGGVADGSASQSDGKTESADGGGESNDGDDGHANPPSQADGPQEYEIVADDGNILWEPPTDGDPVDLSFVPSAARIYLIARPSDILASPHGRDALKALGPEFAALRKDWEQSAGVTLDEVEQLVIGIHDNNSQMPRFTFSVTLKNPADMKARWGNPAANGGEGLYTVAGRRAWLPPAGGGRVFVIGAAEEIEALAAGGVAKPKALVGQYFSQLLKSSDNEQHFIALIDPQFLHTDGRDMFRGQYEKLIEPLDWFFGDDTKAMLSLQFDEDFFAELRLYSRLQKSPTDMRGEYAERIDELPRRLKRYLQLSLKPSPYWQETWLRFPDMIGYVGKQVRSAVVEDEKGGQAVFNFIAPGRAAPNLFAASELAIVTAPGANYETGDPAPSAPSGPRTLDELLAAKVDLGFPQQSLEFAIRDLAAAAKDEYTNLPFDFQIRILGSDLQKEGITRNQQIRNFDARGTAISEILTQLVRKANPVTTVTSPAEVDQKLVWLVGPDPDDASKKIVLITTRAAAGEKNLPLPEVFRPQ